MTVPASISPGSVVASAAVSSVHTRISAQFTRGPYVDLGLPFDSRTINPTGGTGDGTFTALAGGYWLSSPADDDQIGYADGTPGKFYSPNGMNVGADGLLAVGEFGFEEFGGPGHPPDMSAGHTLRQVNRTTGAVSTLAGLSGVPGYADGHGSAARFHSMVALFPTTTGLLLAEYGPPVYPGNNRIRFISYSGMVSTVAFNGGSTVVNGPALSASRPGVNGVTMHPSGAIYACGYPANNVNAGWVCKIANDAQRTVSTVASGLSFPANLFVGDDDRYLYVVGFTSGILWQIDLADNSVAVVTTDLGQNANGAAKGNGCFYYVNSGPAAPGPVVKRYRFSDGDIAIVDGVEGETGDAATNHHGLSCVAFDGTHLYAGDHFGNRITKRVPV